jgi:hypothetical protein
MGTVAKIAAAVGRTLNALGAPGFVQCGDYASESLGTSVRVHCGERFTVLSVNEVDVYFSRLTGRIDGVGTRAQD